MPLVLKVNLSPDDSLETVKEQGEVGCRGAGGRGGEAV